MALAGLLTRDRTGRRVVPRWFAEPDFPWLRRLLEVYLTHVGSPQSALREALAAQTFPGASPARTRLVRAVLDALFRGPRPDPARGARLRAAVFTAAAAGRPRAEVLAQVAQAQRIPVTELESALFADLPHTRQVVAPASVPGLPALAALANQRLLRLLLQATSEVAIEVESNARALVRHARLRGLLVVSAPHAAGVTISGPFALFRHTQLYGRALSELLPFLPWCGRFRLSATVVHGDQALLLELSEHDPIPPAAEPHAFDSAVEARFARDFLRLTRDWELRREPAALPTADSHWFPDFELRHRQDATRRWLLEIVGFWTKDYLQTKLAHLRQHAGTRWILCVDQGRACGRDDFPKEAQVLWFRRRIDARAVLHVVATEPG